MDVTSAGNVMGQAEYMSQAELEPRGHDGAGVDPVSRNDLEISRLLGDVNALENQSPQVDHTVRDWLNQQVAALNRSADQLTGMASRLNAGTMITPGEAYHWLARINNYSIQCQCMNAVGKNISDGTKTLFRNQ